MVFTYFNNFYFRHIKEIKEEKVELKAEESELISEEKMVSKKTFFFIKWFSGIL